MNKVIEKVIVDIIKHELDLPNNYGYTSKNDVIPSVIIYGQNIKLFDTDKLQVTVKTVSVTPYSNRSKLITDNKGKYWQVQDVNAQYMMQIDIYSRNNDARYRYSEVAMALNSIYAQQQADLYNFKIGLISKINNISGIDGGSDINRYAITFNVLAHEQKKTQVAYYDKFYVNGRDERAEFMDINFN